MKILVIGLDCAAPGPLFGLPGLTNIRRLMDVGCYGRLESIVPAPSADAWSGTEQRNLVAGPAWTWLCDQVTDATAKQVEVEGHFFAASDWEHLDEQIGGLLETLDEDCAVLVLSDHDGCNRAECGAFILAAPSCPLSGELQGVYLVDLAPTLLALGGYDVPPFMQGRSLVDGGTGGAFEPALAFSDEELVRQRLDEAFVAEQQRRGGTIIGLLPGSRNQEIEHNLETLLEAAAQVHAARPDTRFLIACLRPEQQQEVQRRVQGTVLPIEVHAGIGVAPTNVWLYRSGVVPADSDWTPAYVDLNDETHWIQIQGSGTFAEAKAASTRF